MCRWLSSGKRLSVVQRLSPRLPNRHPKRNVLVCERGSRVGADLTAESMGERERERNDCASRLTAGEQHEVKLQRAPAQTGAAMRRENHVTSFAMQSCCSCRSSCASGTDASRLSGCCSSRARSYSSTVMDASSIHYQALSWLQQARSAPRAEMKFSCVRAKQLALCSNYSRFHAAAPSRARLE